MVRRPHDIGLEAQHDIASVAGVAGRRQPRQILLERLLRQGRQEFEHRRKALLLLDDAVDRHVADSKARAHPWSPDKAMSRRILERPPSASKPNRLRVQ